MMRKIALLFVFLLSLSAAFAQDRVVTGKVVDETGTGMPGATVSLKGTTKGTVTDIDGKYSISVPATDAVILVSYVGYQQKEIPVGTSNVIDVSLAQDVQNLEQIVVVGYGVQKKSLVTGAISKIDSKDITSVPASRIDQALQGKTSGVYVAQSSGAPGGAMSIKIRGNSSDGKNNPLYIVNGIKTGSIDFLSPSDIESMEILKDAASSAIYGAEGANGVVIITTKKGVKGASEVNYSYYHGWQSAAHTIQPMTSAQYLQYNREAFKYELDGGLVAQAKYDAAMTKYDKMEADGNYTNWIGEIFGNAPMDNHNISFASGTDKGNMMLSAGYFNQDGIIGGAKSNFKRYTFNFNGESEIKSWLTVGSTVTYSNSTKNNLNESSEVGNGIISSALFYDPTITPYYKDDSELPVGWGQGQGPVYDALTKTKDGRIYRNSLETVGDVSNPLSLLELAHNTTNVNKVLGDIHTDIRFTKAIKFTSRLGLDYSLVVDNAFNPKYYFDATNSLTNDSLVSVQSLYTKHYKYNFDNFVTFDKSLFEDFNFNGVLGMSYEKYSPSFLYVQKNMIPHSSPDFAYVSDGRIAAVAEGGVGYRTKYDNAENQNSYFGRLAVNYKEKYMAQANFRKDGSSLFGPNNHYGYFPSFSLGWNLSKENFFKDAFSFVNTAKLRFSWGQNGNKQILDAFMYTSNMAIQTAYVDAAGVTQFGAYPRHPAAPGLVWETSEQTDLGADFAMFQNKVTFSFDYYNKRTKDQLTENSKVSYYHGFAAFPIENNGEVENKGYEFDLAYHEMESDFKYNISANATYQQNKVLAYGAAFNPNGYRMNIGDVVTRYQPGFPIWYFRGYTAVGIFQTKEEIADYKNSDGKPIQKAIPGDIKYKDISGPDGIPDGKIDDNDMKMIGKPNPDWIFGFNLSCSYKGVDLSMFLQGVTGNQIYFSALHADRPYYNKPDFYFTERWTGPGTSTTFPRATYKDGNGNFRSSSLNVHDGDYLRLKNITLGYTLPAKLTGKVNISKLRVYATANNVLTFTKYKGTDPEVGQLDVNQNNTFGIDRGLYPVARLMTMGIDLTF